jgi:cytochrome P450
MTGSMKKIRVLVMQAIQRKREDIERNPASEDSDFIGALLRVQDKDTLEPIPDHLICDEALALLFAGHGKERLF